MLKKGVTLRGIEIFETLAMTGSVAQTAAVTGLSQPAVSQQMRNLETAVGSDLIDHARRPMRLTSAGQLFLRRASAALAELRLAQSEVTVMDLAHLDELSLGIIDDFDDDLTPRLATILADSLSGCRFRMITAGSMDLARALKDQGLPMAIAARTEVPDESIVEYPLARDPFIIVAPVGVTATAPDLLSGACALPFLHYASGQLIAEQIDSYLKRYHTPLPARFEIGSHLALMAMVARGIGWTITTPLGFRRAARFREGMQVIALPAPSTARRISLFARSEWSGQVPRDIARTMRQLLQAHAIGPVTAHLPWLGEIFYLLEDTP